MLSDRRTQGIALMAIGALLVVIGLFGWATSGGAPEDGDIVSSEGNAQAETSTTSSQPGVSTTVSPTTSTSVDAPAAIMEFVPEFAAAIETGDTDFLYETLHPAVTAVFDEETCRDFIDSEILLLEDYQLTGDLSGPTIQSVATFTIEIWEGPISFIFLDDEYDAAATWALNAGEVNWFGECA